MTTVNHVLTGAIIAVGVRRPEAALLLSLLSHFLLDMLPHFGGVAWFEKWGKPMATMAIGDVIAALGALGVALFLFPDQPALIIGCAIAATLPDWPWAIHYLFKKDHVYFSFHQAIQQYERPWGAIVEASYLLVVGTILIRLA